MFDLKILATLMYEYEFKNDPNGFIKGENNCSTCEIPLKNYRNLKREETTSPQQAVINVYRRTTVEIKSKA